MCTRCVHRRHVQPLLRLNDQDAGCLQSMRHGLEHRLQLLHIVGLLGHSNGYYDLLLAHHRLGIVALHVPLPGLHDAAVRVGGISLRLFGSKWLYHLGLSPTLLFACGLFFCPPLLHVLLDSLGCCFSLPLQTFLGFLHALEPLPPSP